MSAPLPTSQPRLQRRFLAIWFPYLPADRVMRARRNASRAEAEAAPPLVLVEKVKGASRLAAVSREARRAGLAPDITLADARARIPQLWVEEMNRPADAALLEAMAEDCDRVTPVVVIDAPDGLLLDITGCVHLFGGEAELRRKLSLRFRRAGVSVRTVIAGAADTARALARFGRVPIVAPGADAEAVRNLPIAALGLSAKDTLAISRAGLKTIGALAERPSRVFAARFGEEMTRRLARLRGMEDAPLTPQRIIPALWMERRFAEPIGRSEDIEAGLGELVREACARLGERREGGRVFEAAFYRTDGAVRRIHVETGRPVRDPMVLARLFRERMDALADPLDPGFGFDMMRLSLLATDALDAIQPGLDRHAVETDEVADLADRLSTRFGAERVLRFVPEDTHDPDRAALITPMQQEVSAASPWPALAEGEPPLRPVQVFDPPQVIEISLVEIPDGPPRRFAWRRKEYHVIRAEGPERIAPEWWREEAGPSRDYYRVEDAAGRRFWLFRTGAYGDGGKPRWYLHGVFA